ncbi:MAG TPA: cation:proton antiporter [Parasegetibacter sp.]|jgi:multicomponent Na+:H+ antiporter subunit F
MTIDHYFDYVIFPLLTASVILVLIRLFKGPEIADRVVALDLVISIGIGAITVYSIRTQKTLFLDVAMILALIAFLGTIAFSYYINKKNSND